MNYNISELDIRWSDSKSEKLKKERGVSFEDIIQTELVAVVKHPKRAHQSLLLFRHEGYVWVVPYVSRGREIFLKTLFPSRKYTRMLEGGEIG